MNTRTENHVEIDSTSFSEQINLIQNIFHNSKDLICQYFKISDVQYAIIYLESLIDYEKIEKYIFIPLKQNFGTKQTSTFALEYWRKSTEFQTLKSKLLKGYSIVLIMQDSNFYFVNTGASFNRSLEEPTNEKIITGSHQGFVENLNINLNILRRTIENENLYIDYITLGTQTNSKIAITYLKGIADPQLIKKIMNRLQNTSVDMVFNPGFIEELIEESVLSPFPQILKTERLDRVKANLIEGRIAIFQDGSPCIIIAPINFFSLYQSPDDYNTRSWSGSLIRLIRLISFWIAVNLPAIYIAIIGFHFEILPNDLLMVVKGAVENIPYPPLIEAIIMEFTIELIREAGIRLPAPIGQTIGIVGGLVIGDAVVKAGLISNTMIVVVAITAISGYVVPSIEMSATVRILRFPMMMAAAVMGFIGIIFGLMVLLIHLCELEPFGYPYFSPIAPFKSHKLKDAIIRLPILKKINGLVGKPFQKMEQVSQSKEQKPDETS